ncbi:uncharacterized protein DFL_009676 [Arthrobotrys flagrans]|uniref:Autophagy-related protein 27 n=1 Tax=Arthrobotrys flagrans TaxID=97331 RepID=A0A436ZSE1_ARTFL|nr:hypothetical protein DFL_009676 [Arthrobotrys flagrans]
MHFLFLSLLVLPPVLGDCARFTTTDRWTRKPRGGSDSYEAGYQFLEDGPVIQVSDYVTCSQMLGYRPPRLCHGNATFCQLGPEGKAEASARFSVVPTNSNGRALETFFGLVSKAAEANGQGDAEPPKFQACGDVAPWSDRAFCLAPGDNAWIRYYPQYFCVNGTAEECTDGPFESGTELVVCGIGELASGDLSLLSNRTIGEGIRSYIANDFNPALDGSLTCGSVAGFELKAWSFGFMGLAIIVGSIL